MTLKSKLKREKLRAQVKSRWYYIFWGACTVSVFAGQIYVGNGYRKMSEKVEDLTEMMAIKFEMELLEKRRTGQSEYMEINPDDYIIWKPIK